MDNARTAVVAALALALAVGLAFVTGIGILSGTTSSTATAVGVTVAVAQVCTPSGPIPTLNPGQAGEALTIFSEAIATGGGLRGLLLDSTETPALVALLVADTESGFHDYGPRPTNTGSIGLFQQRPTQGWGSVAQLETAKYATAAFVTRWMQMPNLDQTPVWVAAQDVQRSGTSAGTNYRNHLAAAKSYRKSILHLQAATATPTQACGTGVPGGEVGPPSAYGLPVGYVVPVGTGPRHTAAIKFALAQLGKSYVWGSGVGPVNQSHWTCSSLTASAWAAAGVQLDAYAGSQQTEGGPVAPSTVAPGDLVLVPGSDPPGLGVAGHVGIYLGSGLVLSAIDPHTGVQVQSWTVFISQGLDAIRSPTG